MLIHVAAMRPLCY